MRVIGVLALAACAQGQHEIASPGPLLTAGGELREPGWSPRQLLAWDPSLVDDPAKLRQWDFFTIMNDRGAVNFTLGDLGVEVATVSAVDFTTGAASSSVLLGDHQLQLSAALGGDASLGTALAYSASGSDWDVSVGLDSPTIGDPATGALVIHRRPEMPYLSNATPFDDLATYFFYEQKVPGMTVDGSVTIGATTFTFDSADSIAVMDWGRGEWPHLVTWRWASGSGTIDGAPFAFNLGEGFGDDRASTENVIFFGDRPCKLAA